MIYNINKMRYPNLTLIINPLNDYILDTMVLYNNSTCLVLFSNNMHLLQDFIEKQKTMIEKYEKDVKEYNVNNLLSDEYEYIDKHIIIKIENDDDFLNSKEIVFLINNRKKLRTTILIRYSGTANSLLNDLINLSDYVIFRNSFDLLDNKFQLLLENYQNNSNYKIIDTKNKKIGIYPIFESQKIKYYSEEMDYYKMNIKNNNIVI